MWHGSVKNEIATGNLDKSSLLSKSSADSLTKNRKKSIYTPVSRRGRKLLDEPEFEGVHFDFELMYTRVTEVLDSYHADEPDADESEEDIIDLTNIIAEVVASEEELNVLPEAELAM